MNDEARYRLLRERITLDRDFYAETASALPEDSPSREALWNRTEALDSLIRHADLIDRLFSADPP